MYYQNQISCRDIVAYVAGSYLSTIYASRLVQMAVFMEFRRHKPLPRASCIIRNMKLDLKL